MSKKKPGSKKLYNHGLSKTLGYKAFIRMDLARRNVNLLVCKEWTGRGEGLKNFLGHMGHPPVGHFLLLKSGQTIYGPDNCEWSARMANPLPLNFIISDGVLPRMGGVYKLLFSNGTFYIGSTADFMIRIGVFKTEMRKGYTHNKRMKDAIYESDSVNFVIVESAEGIDLKKREDFYLKQEAGNPQMLNRSLSAFSNKGILWSKEERELMKVKCGPGPGRPKGSKNKT